MEDGDPGRDGRRAPGLVAQALRSGQGLALVYMYVQEFRHRKGLVLFSNVIGLLKYRQQVNRSIKIITLNVFSN